MQLKRVLLFSVLAVALATTAVADAALAQTFTADSSGLTVAAGPLYGTAGVETDLAASIVRVIRTALSLVGVIFMLLIMYAGALWMTARGNDETIKKARGVLTSAVIGLVIIFSSYAVVGSVLELLISATPGTQVSPEDLPADGDAAPGEEEGILDFDCYNACLLASGIALSDEVPLDISSACEAQATLGPDDSCPDFATRSEAESSCVADCLAGPGGDQETCSSLCESEEPGAASTACQLCRTGAPGDMTEAEIAELCAVPCTATSTGPDLTDPSACMAYCHNHLPSLSLVGNDAVYCQNYCGDCADRAAYEQCYADDGVGCEQACVAPSGSDEQASMNSCLLMCAADGISLEACRANCPDYNRAAACITQCELQYPNTVAPSLTQSEGLMYSFERRHECQNQCLGITADEDVPAGAVETTCYPRCLETNRTWTFDAKRIFCQQGCLMCPECESSGAVSGVVSVPTQCMRQCQDQGQTATACMNDCLVEKAVYDSCLADDHPPFVCIDRAQVLGDRNLLDSLGHDFSTATAGFSDLYYLGEDIYQTVADSGRRTEALDQIYSSVYEKYE
jgi:hypothetical protein